jgi:hypothetical protein
MLQGPEEEVGVERGIQIMVLMVALLLPRVSVVEEGWGVAMVGLVLERLLELQETGALGLLQAEAEAELIFRARLTKLVEMARRGK